MIDLVCHYADGDKVYTGFNGTPEEAKEYFEGRYFNFGIEGDLMKKCVRVEVL
jgi:hypothetical protein